jgi:DNA-binding response OmpR family regulator
MVATMLRILLVEDDHDLASTLWDYLESQGFTVDYARDGVAGLRLALTGNHDLVVLDLSLPRLNGLDVCRQLRKQGRQMPVLMMSGRETLDDKLRGFADGADDYLVKPFALKELVARLHALLRPVQQTSPEALRVADLEYDLRGCCVQRAGKPIQVPPSGLRLLEVLMRNSPRVVSRSEMERTLWGEATGDANAMRSHLYALRMAIDKPFDKPLLHTLHGIGCRLTDDISY